MCETTFENAKVGDIGETTFENAQIGDRVYCSLFKCINPDDKTNASIYKVDKDIPFGIKIKLDVLEYNDSHCFSEKGCYFLSKEADQVLFWSKPEFVVPTRPKKKKIIEGWIEITPNPCDADLVAFTTNIYKSKDILTTIRGRKSNIKKVAFEIEE